MLSKFACEFPCEMKLFADPVRFGAGKYFAIAIDTGSMRFAGIWLFGNGDFASVSVIFNGLPSASTALEKSPRNSSGVGTMPRCDLPAIDRRLSHVNRKNVRLCPL